MKTQSYRYASARTLQYLSHPQNMALASGRINLLLKEAHPSPSSRRACTATKPAGLLQSLHPAPTSNECRGRNQTRLRKTGSSADASQDRTPRQKSGLSQHAEAGRLLSLPAKLSAGACQAQPEPQRLSLGPQQPQSRQRHRLQRPSAHLQCPPYLVKCSSLARQQPPSPPFPWGRSAYRAEAQDEEQVIRQTDTGRVQPPEVDGKISTELSACSREAGLRAGALLSPSRWVSVACSTSPSAAQLGTPQPGPTPVRGFMRRRFAARHSHQATCRQLSAH